jgi:hypothetical protein
MYQTSSGDDRLATLTTVAILLVTTVTGVLGPILFG